MDLKFPNSVVVNPTSWKRAEGAGGAGLTISTASTGLTTSTCLTLSRKSGQVDYAAFASSISSNLAGLMLPIVECLRTRL